MKKHLSSQKAPVDGDSARTGLGETNSQSQPNTDPTPSASKPQPTEASAGPEKALTAGGRTYVNDVLDLDGKLQDLVSKMLTEGSTFEDVVEAIDEREGSASRSTPSRAFSRGTGKYKPNECAA